MRNFSEFSLFRPKPVPAETSKTPRGLPQVRAAMIGQLGFSLVKIAEPPGRIALWYNTKGPY
jgi:hypothetical protein